MQEHDVLIINSYAGSLTLAATQLGLAIRGSYEKDGYGIPIQRENFPGLNYVERYERWPLKDDLSNTIVLAHPPCAAFSQQNSSKNAKGTGADKFQCTVRAIDYALRNECAALAIESVPAALEGARAVHEELAEQYGYQIFRILHNPTTLGVPQWRPRFWIIFSKQISAFHIHHEPRFRTVGDCLITDRELETDSTMEKDFSAQWLKLIDLGIEPWKLLAGSCGYGGLPALLRPMVPEKDGGEIAKKYCVGGNFMSHCMRVLDPQSFATTLLFDSWWVCNARNLRPDEYKQIMGFPADYKIPAKFKPKFREYLSRGVCPPVAKWITEAILQNLRRTTVPESPHHFKILPGEILDLNIKKGEFSA